MDDLLPLIEAEIPALRRYARYLTRDVDDADDLVQDCLARALNNLEKWQQGTNLRAWLFVILRNLYINDLRRSKRWTAVSETSLEYLGGGVSGNQEARHELRQLQKAFDGLSFEHREILCLVTIDGFGYEEASQILSVPVGTVRSRLSRARANLKASADGTVPETAGDDPPPGRADRLGGPTGQLS